MSTIVYEVGMPDPTPDGSTTWCGEPCYPIGECTWAEDHDGQHVAGDGEKIVGVRTGRFDEADPRTWIDLPEGYEWRLHDPEVGDAHLWSPDGRDLTETW